MKELYAVIDLNFRKDQPADRIPDLEEEPSVEVYDTWGEAGVEAQKAVQDDDVYADMRLVVHWDALGAATILYTFGVTTAVMYQQGALMWGRLNQVVNAVRATVVKHQQEPTREGA